MLGATHLTVIREMNKKMRKLEQRLLMKDAVIEQQAKRITELTNDVQRANVYVAVEESLKHGR